MRFRFDCLQNLRKILVSRLHFPNGHFTHGTHISDHRLCDDVLLKNVLFIQDFHCNLLFVSKLTIDLSCDASMYPKFMIFQDLSNERVLKVA